MCGSFFGGGGSPSPPPVPVAPVVRRQPRLADEGVRKAQEDVKDRARRFAALGGTLVTGGGGLATEANTQKKTLLGA